MASKVVRPLLQPKIELHDMTGISQPDNFRAVALGVLWLPFRKHCSSPVIMAIVPVGNNTPKEPIRYRVVVRTWNGDKVNMGYLQSGNIDFDHLLAIPTLARLDETQLKTALHLAVQNPSKPVEDTARQARLAIQGTDSDKDNLGCGTLMFLPKPDHFSSFEDPTWKYNWLGENTHESSNAASPSGASLPPAVQNSAQQPGVQ